MPNVSQRKTLDDSRMIWFDVCISYNYAMQDALSYEKVEVIYYYAKICRMVNEYIALIPRGDFKWSLRQMLSFGKGKNGMEYQ